MSRQTGKEDQMHGRRMHRAVEDRMKKQKTSKEQ